MSSRALLTSSDDNEVIATVKTQDIYLSLELQKGEGLKFEIYKLEQIYKITLTADFRDWSDHISKE